MGNIFQRPAGAVRPAAGVVVAAVLLATGEGEAQERVELEEVVVTATRVPTPVREVASSVTVITAEEIERRQTRTVVDTLRSVPGMTVVQSGGPGTQTSLFLRGTESNHVLFLINGMRVADPSSTGGIFDPTNLLSDNIERIEIIRGPHSVLYGSDAIGGVVNIITKTGEGPLTASALVEAGSRRTLNTQLGTGGSFGRLDLRLDVSRFSTAGDSIAPEDEGNAESDGHRNRSVSFSLGWRPVEEVRARLYGQFTDTETEIDDFGADDLNQENLRAIRILQGTVSAELLGGVWRPTLRAGVTDQDLDNEDPAEPGSGGTPSASHFDGRVIEAELQNDLSVHESGTVVLGLETQSEFGESGGDAFFGFDDTVHTHSGFAQYQFAFVERFFGTAGVRVDDNENFGTEPTFRVAGGYRHLETDTTIRASVGTGFKAPSLTDLFGQVPGLFTGNPDLQPEESTGYEVGVEQRLLDGRLAVGATYFHNDIENLIDGFVFDSGLGLFTAKNVDQATTRGVETFVEAEPVEDVSVRATWTYLRATDDSDGSDLLRRPKHEAELNLAWRPEPRTTVNLETLFVGRRKDSGPITLASHTVVNLAASYRIADRVSAVARVTNLFDRDFENPDNFAAPGVGVFAGFRARF